MKKDIEIIKESKVYVSVIQEWNSEYEWHDWVAYVINDTDVEIENVIVVSKGNGTKDGEKVITSTMRHGMKAIEAKSYAKVELINGDAINLNNIFNLTYFMNNKLFDGRYTFRENTINNRALRDIPCINMKGIMASNVR
ncbi:MAG: hypothetical protein KAG96_02060 [Ichthyobacteriaceae bacterium]|nr:hypothetical protein [Ichthyobacteriaceae bacterium]